MRRREVGWIVDRRIFIKFLEGGNRSRGNAGRFEIRYYFGGRFGGSLPGFCQAVRKTGELPKSLPIYSVRQGSFRFGDGLPGSTTCGSSAATGDCWVGEPIGNRTGSKCAERLGTRNCQWRNSQRTEVNRSHNLRGCGMILHKICHPFRLSAFGRPAKRCAQLRLRRVRFFGEGIDEFS